MDERTSSNITIISNAEKLARAIRARFPRSFDPAISELASDPITSDREKYIYVPCSPLYPIGDLEESLVNPSANFAFGIDSPTDGKPLYTSWEAALEGKAVDSVNKTKTPHPFFLAYVIMPGVIVDCIDREGKSLLTKPAGIAYKKGLSEYYGRPIEWKMPPSLI